MMEVRRRKTRLQVDTKYGTHVENNVNTTISESRNQRDEELDNPKESNTSNSIESKQVTSNDAVRARIKISLEIDLIATILLIAGILTRFYHLEEPRNIVFDELHYGKYVGLYMKRTFFFDSHPPLGKQLVSAAAYLAGFDGQFKFDRIGSSYIDAVPLYALRLVPAICGSLLIPTGYHLILELGLKQWAATIGGILLLLGIANLTCAMCVKYVGFYSMILALFLIARDYWSLLPKKTLSSAMLWIHLLIRLVVLITVIVTVYLSIFYVHLAILSKAGPHDSVMTSAFQASLEGGLASITKGQPLEVTHGSQITLRHTYGRACWLHSHNHVYPLRYPDGRGSSHQQQVTCYSFKDVNNWWIVKRPDRNDLVVTKPSEPIRHGDVIQLVHGITSRALNSHDVAAPMTPQSQEVSCYIDYNVSMPSQNLWRVEITNRDHSGDAWHAIQSQVRLIHVHANGAEFALKFSGRQLPDWGFNQHEVVADRLIDQTNSIWNVEEHRYTRSEDQKQRERELISAEMIPLQATALSFWEKFAELQIKMLFGGQESQNSHMYSSGPLEWPLMSRGIAYWVSNDSNAQVHLLGNIAIWYSGTISVIVYSGLLIFYLMRRRRKCFDITEKEWEKFVNNAYILLAGYFFHFLPFIFVERTLFLHHYLPAFIFKILLTAATIDHLYYLIGTHRPWNISLYILTCGTIAWILFVIYVFKKFIVFSYGTSALSAKDVIKLRWKDTWDFIVHKT